MTDITLPMLKEALPSKMKSCATQEFLDKLNGIVSDPEMAEHVKKNFIGYAYIMGEGKFGIDEYLNAVTYVSFKLTGMSNRDAYIRTFPDKYQRFLQIGVSAKDQASYIAAFARGKLVNLIMEQTLVPTWVLNQDIYQKAINTQAELMASAKSERVRAMAADSILNHLKKPDAVAPLINLDMRQDSGIEDLKKALVNLAESQRKSIAQGANTKDIIEQELVIDDA